MARLGVGMVGRARAAPHRDVRRRRGRPGPSVFPFLPRRGCAPHVTPGPTGALSHDEFSTVCDLTQSYAATGGGIRTHPHAKRAWLDAHTDARHVLAPGPGDATERDGRHVTHGVTSPPVPSSSASRLLRNGHVRRLLAEARRAAALVARRGGSDSPRGSPSRPFSSDGPVLRRLGPSRTPRSTRPARLVMGAPVGHVHAHGRRLDPGAAGVPRPRSPRSTRRASRRIRSGSRRQRGGSSCSTRRSRGPRSRSWASGGRRRSRKGTAPAAPGSGSLKPNCGIAYGRARHVRS